MKPRYTQDPADGTWWLQCTKCESLYENEQEAENCCKVNKENNLREALSIKVTK
jgi:hypothetical protein